MRLTQLSLVLVALSGCAGGESRAGDRKAYTLYRSSPTSPTLRVRVATFDEPDDATYNQTICEEFRELKQQAVATKTALTPPRYWCEMGYYRK